MARRTTTTRPAKRPARTASRSVERRRWRGFGWLSLLAILALAGAWATRLYDEVSHLISERRAALSSSIYSAPHPLRAGDDIRRSHLLDRLASLRYVAVTDPQRPGEYARTGDELLLRLRGFQAGTIEQNPALLRLRLSGERIASISDAAGNAVDDASLEPETIGRLIEGAPAERVEVRLEDQKPYLVRGLLATEDQYFYWHPGFNPFRIVAAAVEDLRAGRLAAGASTLTQQLARTFLERRERSFDRKLRELAVAIVLEIRLSKDEILERYINDVAMGAYGGAPIHGMPQAARYFFNKDLSQVTPAEAATLIGMVQGPSIYDPRRHPEASTKRRDVVLGAMKDQGVLDEAAYQAAVATPLQTSKPPLLRRAPWFTDLVLSELARLPGLGTDYTGLKVYTTLDAALQADTMHALVSNLDRLEKSRRELHRSEASGRLQSAAVAIDVKSGAIRALVGGRNYAETQFDRATSALRQPGSTFKAFTYLTALDPTRSPIQPPLTLASMLPNRPMSFGGWTPENYEESDKPAVTALDALAESLNIPAAYVGSRVGAAAVARTAHELGISQPLEAMLPIAIGAEETTLVDLVSAYGVFASGGLRAPAYAIDAVVGRDGDLLWRHHPENERVVSAAAAWLVTGALRTVLTSGTGASASRLGLARPAAGKTGTTQDYRDAWFVGYTPDLAAGVWVGFDTPRSIGLTGAAAALPPWVSIIESASPSAPRDFTVPSGIVTVAIDPDSGGRATASCPKRVAAPFLAGSEPRDECPLHGEQAGAARNWGGWRSSTTPAEAPANARTAKPGIFRSMGNFFGSIFHRR